MKHLKLCSSLKKKRKIVANKKVCPICSKVFAQKSNCDRHIIKCHRRSSNAFDESIETFEDETIPSMVFPADPFVTEVVDAIPTAIPEDEEHVAQPNEQSTIQLDENLDTQRKQSRLEKTLNKIKMQMQIDYSMNVAENVLTKLKRDLRENRQEAIKYIFDCFEDMLDDDGFVAWLANATGYKPN